MATLRKYKPRQTAKKSLITIDRTLLAGVVGFGAIGLAQPTLLTLASNNEPSPAAIQMARQAAPAPTVVAAKPQADYTPVGSIEKKPAEAPKPETQPAPNPLGLRLSR